MIALDTSIGLVAVLPIGMAQASSVFKTAEVGVSLRIGEEVSYFQFGGSDIIVLFEALQVGETKEPQHNFGMKENCWSLHPNLPS